MNNMKLSESTLEKYVSLIFADLGFEVCRHVRIDDCVIDILARYNDISYAVEVKSGYLNKRNLKKYINNVSEKLSNEYKKVLILENLDLLKEEVLSLQTKDVIVIDTKKFKRLQNELYIRNNPFSFLDNALSNYKARKFINTSLFTLTLHNNERDANCEFLNDKSDKLKLTLKDKLQGFSESVTSVYLDLGNDVFYDTKNKNVGYLHNKEEVLNSIMQKLAKAGVKNIVILTKDRNLYEYLDNKIIKDPIEFISTRK